MRKVSSLESIIPELKGAYCSSCKLGERNSISIGFGEQSDKAYPPHRGPYREYEAGSYVGNWCLMQNGSLIAGASDSGDRSSIENKVSHALLKKRLIGWPVYKDNAVQMAFETGENLIFESSKTRFGESIFHIFYPKNSYARYDVKGGWQDGPSNIGWDSKI